MSIIYYDYSTMVVWEGYPTGVPRTVLEIAKPLMDEVEFVCINDDLKSFHYYDIDTKTIGNLVEFQEADSLFSPGATWAYGCYLTEVKRITEIGVKYYQLFYDLIPALFPFYYEDYNFGPYYQKSILDLIPYCTESFAISKSTKQDIINACKTESVNYNKINVIRLGDALTKPNSEVVGVKEAIKSLDKFILTVGTIEYRKNHIILLNAYRLLISEGKTDLPTLVIVGREGFLNNSLVYQVEHDLILRDRIKILSDVSDGDLDYLYTNCMFTVYPALYEGWGLPIAESLQYGKQCICSNSSSMVEIAPKLTRFAHPLKVDEWATQVYELSNDVTILNRESNKIVNSYQTTEWKDVVNNILKLIKGNKN